MKRASSIVFAVALSVAVSGSKCEPDPPADLEDEGVSEVSGEGPAQPSPAGGTVNADGASPRELLLAELSTRLDRVQTAGSEEQVSTGGGVALEPLLGMTRSELRSALGAPHTCEKDRVAPCQTNDDWFYSFYHLPEGALGGGPELLLQFDQKGTCVSARWVITR
jgi:hypothetical protein